jgi:hypothetical protein
MRQPRTSLTAVDTEKLQTLLHVAGQKRRRPSVVLEDEHADAPRLAIPSGRESDLSRGPRGIAQRLDDRVELTRRPVAEERERDVQVLASDEPYVPELLPLPVLELVEDGVG